MGTYLKSRPKRAIVSVVFLTAILTILTGFAIVGATTSGGTIWLPLFLWILGVSSAASLGQLVIGELEDGAQ